MLNSKFVLFLIISMNALRPFTVARSASNSTRNNLSNIRHTLLQRNNQQQGGVDIPVSNPRAVLQAWRRVREITTSARLREFERRDRHYVKPKLRRQQRQAYVEREERKADFKSKVQMALEMMRSGC